MGHGEFIKKIRKEKHLTQKELAEGILSKNFLSKFERGESKITSEIFLNLLEFWWKLIYSIYKVKILR